MLILLNPFECYLFILPMILKCLLDKYFCNSQTKYKEMDRLESMHGYKLPIKANHIV